MPVRLYQIPILGYWQAILLFLSALNLSILFSFRGLQFLVPSFVYTTSFFSATTLDTTKLSRFEIPVLNTMKERVNIYIGSKKIVEYKKNNTLPKWNSFQNMHDLDQVNFVAVQLVIRGILRSELKIFRFFEAVRINSIRCT